ncbi:DUF1501 domain-containing protein [Stakelama sediminis]|uniref:Uncharacterized protein (DUF1501 family) n=1 Tax=Stakelama sediminis TaxID=463200 RepID=A0A840YUW3_9SPHN|nr:DUF1501 domain-containing protein [Stakelama sediminis]MBB5717366.1 uncharacterized protein (DUF1501 family) [Stakelama sediminis]
MITRRGFVSGATVGMASLGLVPGMAFARTAGNRRFVFIIQRGAADGLHIVAPVGDPAYVSARGALAKDFADAPRLDSMFALHPALERIGGLFKQGDALFVHAIASPYRDRSHFDGQNVLESGGVAAYRIKTGWLNRILPLLPADEARAIAVSETVPLTLRGSVQVASYAPSRLPGASADLLDRVSALYAHDPQLDAVWSKALGTRAMAGDLSRANVQDAAQMGALAAKLLVGDKAARIAMIETEGWDTHSAQSGRLRTQLKRLDAMVGGLRDGLGEAWADTVVLVATEFGRTVAINGTGGTDHGTASLAMLLGGAVRGGKVRADWPGLGQGALYQGRDLKPTAGLDALITGAMAEHFGLDPVRVKQQLFPELSAATPMQSLIRT